MIIKFLITLFVVFAISRAYLRYRDGGLSALAFFAWGMLWVGVLLFVWWPKISDYIAGSVGIGRGIDALVYLSIVALFYGMFRVYIKLEFIERELTSLVRGLALRDHTKSSEDDSRQDHVPGN